VNIPRGNIRRRRSYYEENHPPGEKYHEEIYPLEEVLI
jgi:hypothetical protein